MGVSCERLADLFPVSCLPYPNTHPALLCLNRYTLMRNPFTSPLAWNPQTLLGLLSIPEAMRSSDQHISPSASHPAHPVSHPRSHLHRSATPAAQLLLHVHPATPPPSSYCLSCLSSSTARERGKSRNTADSPIKEI